jgi:hypothetical protein
MCPVASFKRGDIQRRVRFPPRAGTAVIAVALIIVVAITLVAVLLRFSSTQPFDPARFYGCYSADGLNVEIGDNFIRLPGSAGSLPAHVNRDKHGPFVVVEHPVWYRRNAAGGLDLVSYRGSGTIFRLQDGPRPTIELVVVNGPPWPSLAMEACS